MPPENLAPELAALHEDEVHIWHILLDPGAALSRSKTDILSPDELQRRQRFRRPLDAGRFVSARTALREILATYLERPPGKLRFAYGAQGKPVLESGELNFNLSHSGERALLAVSRHIALGIDIEQLAPRLNYDRLVARFFTTAEKKAWEALTPELKPAAFYRAWTRKEAAVKTAGESLLGMLHDFSVSLDPEQPAQIVAATGRATVLQKACTLHDIDNVPGYAACVCVANAHPRFKQYTYDG